MLPGERVEKVNKSSYHFFPRFFFYERTEKKMRKVVIAFVATLAAVGVTIPAYMMAS
jgi:hypothetical protein